MNTHGVSCKARPPTTPRTRHRHILLPLPLLLTSVIPRRQTRDAAIETSATGQPPASASSACAGLLYVYSDYSSNECPAGAVRITTEAACRSAADALGLAYDGSASDPAYPRGGPIASTCSAAPVTFVLPSNPCFCYLY
jgi:hypothetical protein